MEDEVKYGQYKSFWKVGEGGFGYTFLAVKEGDVKKKVYILKTFIDNDDDNKQNKNKNNLINEINMLEDLKKGEKNPIQFIPYLYDSNKDVMTNPYYTIDYFSNGTLLYYVQNYRFSEKQAKIIFKKIVEGIKFCHNKNICHLDIKPENIIFDNKFEPIIIDFGLSKKIKDNKNEIVQYLGKTGTKQYECPEMWKIGKYTGVEADIFSLGALLFNLISSIYGFKRATKNDKYYSLIINDKDGTYKAYWEFFKKAINLTPSDNFKDLYTKLIAYEPKNRLSIEEILDHPWFDDIKNLSIEEEKKEIELKLKEIYNASNESIEIQQIVEGYEHRGLDGENVFSNPELRAKKIPNDIINPNRYIIIDGYLDEREFMNNLYYKIIDNRDDLADDLNIKESDEALRLEVIFEEEVEVEGENHKKCIIDIELFKYDENRYLLDFLKKSGNLSDYYKNFKKIKDIIQFGEIKNENKSNNDELSI